MADVEKRFACNGDNWSFTVLGYAQNRGRFGSGEIQIFDSSRNVERTIPFSEADRILASLRWDLVLLHLCPRAGARHARTVCTASFCFRRLRARGWAARHSRCFRV